MANLDANQKDQDIYGHTKGMIDRMQITWGTQFFKYFYSSKYIPMSFRIFLISFIAISCFSCSQTGEKTAGHLGVVDFKVTGKKAAQPYFEKGLLLLHSFEYADAAESFRQAIHLDTNFVMAYWGEAMTYTHALWRHQDFDKAMVVLDQLDTTANGRVNKAVTPLEKDFIRAINILYGEGTKATRDSNYAVFMGILHDQYPGNDEVTAFYSIALLGSVQVGRDDKIYEHAAEMAKEVLAHNPNHPGALHYLIHASDDPKHAGNAVLTADAYAKVAPDAAHALHMPTHIYLALGMWDKVISSNIDAWEASKARKARKNLTNDALGYHTYYWLMYGYLQKGEKEKALSIIDTMKSLVTELPGKSAREYMIQQKSTYLAETNEYGSPVNDMQVDVFDLNVVIRAINYFADAMNLYNKRDAAGMDKIILQLSREISLANEKLTTGNVAMCSSANSTLPNELDVKQSTIMLLELKAMQAQLRKNNKLTEKYLKEASAMEINTSFAFGPPLVVKPSFEMYGEWLLEMKRPKEALQQYENALKAAPGRLLALNGKKKAEEMLNEAKQL